MQSFSVLAIATLAATTLGRGMTVVEAHSDGSTRRFCEAFPSLDEEAVSTLIDDGFVVIAADDGETPRFQFARILHDLQQENTLVTATISYIGIGGVELAYTCRDGVLEAVQG